MPRPAIDINWNALAPEKRYSFREAASALGMPLNSLRIRYWRGKFPACITVTNENERYLIHRKAN